MSLSKKQQNLPKNFLIKFLYLYKKGLAVYAGLFSETLF